MKTLVTGASGFLGTALCSKLRELGYSVDALNSQRNDLTKKDSLNPYCQTVYDHIFHLAAWTQAGDFCLTHTGEQWVINQLINTHVLTWWHDKQPQAKLTCIGTSCGYDPTLPLSEINYLKGEPIDSLFTYAMTKRMLLSGLMALNKQYGLSYLYLIPPTLYGPGYHPKGKQLHFIFDLIKKISNGKQYDDPVTLWGDGTQRRELLHVNDFVEAIITLSQKEKNVTLNIGCGQDHSIKEFATKICSLVGYPQDAIAYDISKYVGAKAKLLVVEKLKTFFPTFSATPLEYGLKESVEAFLEKIPWKGKTSSSAVTAQETNTAR